MNYMSPFFSIVMANYNSGHYIERAIQSVLSQSCKDFELIVVDGGSSDESVDIIKKYTDKLSWWVSEPDKGQSDAFNKGFSHATGRYYTWLNADDLLLPNVLEKVKEGGFEKAVLRPLMIVAGDHANNDMAGDDEDSWKSIFEAAGYDVTCVVEGLGQLPEIQALFVQHAKAAIDSIK